MATIAATDTGLDYIGDDRFRLFSIVRARRKVRLSGKSSEAAQSTLSRCPARCGSRWVRFQSALTGFSPNCVVSLLSEAFVRPSNECGCHCVSATGGGRQTADGAAVSRVSRRRARACEYLAGRRLSHRAAVVLYKPRPRQWTADRLMSVEALAA